MEAIVAALVVAAVAAGAATDVRIHRLHVPPPPTVEARARARRRPPPALPSAARRTRRRRLRPARRAADRRRRRLHRRRPRASALHGEQRRDARRASPGTLDERLSSRWRRPRWRRSARSSSAASTPRQRRCTRSPCCATPATTSSAARRASRRAARRALHGHEPAAGHLPAVLHDPPGADAPDPHGQLRSTQTACPSRRSIRPGASMCDAISDGVALLGLAIRTPCASRARPPAGGRRGASQLGVLDVDAVVDHVGEVAAARRRRRRPRAPQCPAQCPGAERARTPGSDVGAVGERLEHARVAQGAQDARADHWSAAPRRCHQQSRSNVARRARAPTRRPARTGSGQRARDDPAGVVEVEVREHDVGDLLRSDAGAARAPRAGRRRRATARRTARSRRRRAPCGRGRARSVASTGVGVGSSKPGPSASAGRSSEPQSSRSICPAAVAQRHVSRTRATACCRRTSLEPSRSSTVLAEIDEHDVAGLQVADLRSDGEHDGALEASLGHVRGQHDAPDGLFLHRRLDQHPVVERLDEGMAVCAGFEWIHDPKFRTDRPRARTVRRMRDRAAVARPALRVVVTA